MKKCPYCAEEIQDDVIKCRHCKSDLQESISQPANQQETQQTEGTKKCPECKEDIKIDATLCRYCGTKIVNSEKNAVPKGLLGCLIFLAMIVIIFFILNSGGSEKTNNTDNRDKAWVCAQMKIEDMLLSPKTAEFEFGGATNSTKSIGDEKYEIKSYVDAENAFSAKIRQNFKCTVKYKVESDTCETYCNFL